MLPNLIIGTKGVKTGRLNMTTTGDLSSPSERLAEGVLFAKGTQRSAGCCMNERDKMDETVLLGHGSGGTMMKRIIDEVFFEAYADEELLEGNDAASLPAPAVGERIAYSTDSFVVTPHFFPGGDIGRLAVCGTVNDVATSGAVPKYLSCGFILEEGFPVADLKRICKSMAEMAKEAGVHIVTGDTKVVNRGHGDGVHQHQWHRLYSEDAAPALSASRATRSWLPAPWEITALPS